jgi:hypothetical protein
VRSERRGPLQFARRLDCLLDLLDVTADALVATWDQRMQGISAKIDFKPEGDFKPTIH